MADFKSTVTSEDSIESASSMTPKQAQAEIDAIMNDKPCVLGQKNVTARKR